VIPSLQILAIVSFEACLFSGGFGYIKGLEHGNEKYLVLKSEVADAQSKSALDTAKKQAESSRISLDTVEGYTAAIDYWRDHPRTVRVQSPAGCGARSLPAVPDAPAAVPGLSDGGSKGGLSITVEQCTQLANDSLMDDIWINAVKGWTKRQHLIGSGQ